MKVIKFPHLASQLRNIDSAERRSSPDVSRYERALNCTTKTHRCLHATHAYTGIPCAAYIPMMNHHTMPKLGFGQYKSSPSGVGSFFLPKILTNPTDRSCPGSSASYLTPIGGGGGAASKVALELTHGSNKQIITLPSEKLDNNKRYYVTFTLNPNDHETNPSASFKDTNISNSKSRTDPPDPEGIRGAAGTDHFLLSPTTTGKSAEGQPHQQQQSSSSDAQHSAERQQLQQQHQQQQSHSSSLPAVVEEDSNLESSSGPSPSV
ncbi:AAEL004525-PA [Aedes aegypti]|uniref:AAEL004525-PA n=1 Tax=Aedes aegypti TaxID=7159 RepID=Q17CM5_AEDAE|nr:AAEL004525-PA [Aedes aegypti]